MRIYKAPELGKRYTIEWQKGVEAKTDLKTNLVDFTFFCFKSVLFKEGPRPCRCCALRCFCYTGKQEDCSKWPLWCLWVFIKPSACICARTLSYLILIIRSSFVLWSHHEQWIRDYWTIAPRGNAGLEQASVHIFVNQSIYNLVLCVFSVQSTLFNIYCWLINIELMTNVTVTHA